MNYRKLLTITRREYQAAVGALATWFDRPPVADRAAAVAAHRDALDAVRELGRLVDYLHRRAAAGSGSGAIPQYGNNPRPDRRPRRRR